MLKKYDEALETEHPEFKFFRNNSERHFVNFVRGAHLNLTPAHFFVDRLWNYRPNIEHHSALTIAASVLPQIFAVPNHRWCKAALITHHKIGERVCYGGQSAKGSKGRSVLNYPSTKNCNCY
jgi:hypothetical protein